MRAISFFIIAFVKTTYITILVFTIVCVINCNEKVQHNHWEEAFIDRNISKSIVYTQLDKQNEIFSFGEKTDSLTKRTSDIAYFSGEKINLTDTGYSKYNNCRANLLHDTLGINIGIGTGFGGQGFVITYYNQKFYTEPYSWSDVIDPDASKPIYRIIYQKLTLDKPTYKLGDSLFGKIDFKIIEINRNRNPIQHLAEGYFRARIEKPWWRST